VWAKGGRKGRARRGARRGASRGEGGGEGNPSDFEALEIMEGFFGIIQRF